MTVYEWINLKDNVIINFNKFIDSDYTENLEIKMDVRFKYVTSNDEGRLTYFPVTITKTFYNVPQNDADMVVILDQMYRDLMGFCNEINYRNE